MMSFGFAVVFLIVQLCYSFAQVFLEQTPPEGSLCLGDVVMFTCAVENQNQLVWRYTLNGETMSRSFRFDDTPNDNMFLGPLKLLLVSTKFEGGSNVGNITSTAMFTSGLTKDNNGAEITCVKSDPESVTISFAVPNITIVTYCKGTISWNPPLCDADCVISVDGQDLDTVPCKTGNLGTNVSNLDSKMVEIVATDGVNQNISTDVTTEDCSGFVVTSSDMVSSTESPSAEGDIQAGVIVGIVFAILLVVGVGLILPVIGIVRYMYLHHQHSKKEGTDHNQQDRDDDDKTLTVDAKKSFRDCHQHPITHCAISPDAKYVATADSSMVVRFWEISFIIYSGINDCGTFDELIERIRERKKKEPEIPKRRNLLLSLNWISQDESTKLVLTYNSCVIICDTSNDDLVTLYEPKLGKDSSNASMLCTACSPDTTCTFAVSFTTDVTRDPPLGYLLIGNCDELHKQKPKTLSKREACILCMSFSPTGKKLVTGNINGSIRMYTNVSDSSEPAYFEWKIHTGRVHDVQFGSKDEEKVYSLGQDGFFCLWDSSTTGAPTRMIKLEGYQQPPQLTCTSVEYSLIRSAPLFGKCLSHPAIGRSKLFGCCFAYKYILISSMERMILYKADADFELNRIERKLPEGRVSCLDCMTHCDEEYAICILGSSDNSVHFVRLRYTLRSEGTVPETDDGKPRIEATNREFEENGESNERKESGQTVHVPANTTISKESETAL